MNSAAKFTALIILAFSVVGCSRKPKATPPAAAQAPSLPVSNLAKNTPPPQLPPASIPKVEPPPPKAAAPAPKPKPEKPSRHKSHHTTVDAGAPEQTAVAVPASASPSAPATPSGPSEQASNGGSSDISPIGQLAAAGESTNVPRRNQIQTEISTTEKGLDDLKRPLSKDEQTTAAQIRTFLEKAKDSMKQEDLDGANILVTKAKVLLAELTNP